jgi:hypothetical protein
MLNEPSILATGQSAQPVAETPIVTTGPDGVYDQLEAAVLDVMDIQQVERDPAPQIRARFTGRLRLDSETAYDRLDERFAAKDCHVILTTDEDERHVVIALKGRIRPRPRPVWPNALLLVLTLLSLLFAGAAHEAGMRDDDSLALWRGLPYAVSMILILGAHELGHYFAAQYHRVRVTLPYFIPAPFGFGTLGAFIQLREPMRNKKVLFDVGVAGPLVGLVVALPILFIGLATSNVEPLPNEPYYLEGDSILYASAKYAIFGELLPNGREDVFINQLAKAGWTGLFITGLNLIPLGQLDGGHVVFTLLGKYARRLYWPILGTFLALSFFKPAWFLWTMLLFLLGRAYAVPLDTVTELDSRRRWLGYVAMIIFVLVFVPNPLASVQP